MTFKNSVFCQKHYDEGWVSVSYLYMFLFFLTGLIQVISPGKIKFLRVNKNYVNPIFFKEN